MPTKTNDIRKVLTSPTPLYFAAGVIDKLRETAPERLAAVKERAADPKAVQERLAQQAKQTQSKLTAALSGFDTDLKKLREQAQHLALQGVGLAAEYAIKAREGYGELAERGRGAVQTWREEKNGADKALDKTHRRVETVVVEEEERPRARAAAARKTTARGGTARTGAAKKAAARKTTAARKSTASSSEAAKKSASVPTPKAVAKKETAAKKTAKQAPKSEKPAEKPQA